MKELIFLRILDHLILGFAILLLIFLVRIEHWKWLLKPDLSYIPANCDFFRFFNERRWVAIHFVLRPTPPRGLKASENTVSSLKELTYKIISNKLILASSHFFIAQWFRVFPTQVLVLWCCSLFSRLMSLFHVNKSDSPIMARVPSLCVEAIILG